MFTSIKPKLKNSYIKINTFRSILYQVKIEFQIWYTYFRINNSSFNHHSNMHKNELLKIIFSMVTMTFKSLQSLNLEQNDLWMCWGPLKQVQTYFSQILCLFFYVSMIILMCFFFFCLSGIQSFQAWEVCTWTRQSVISNLIHSHHQLYVQR